MWSEPSGVRLVALFKRSQRSATLFPLHKATARSAIYGPGDQLSASTNLSFEVPATQIVRKTLLLLMSYPTHGSSYSSPHSPRQSPDSTVYATLKIAVHEWQCGEAVLLVERDLPTLVF